MELMLNLEELGITPVALDVSNLESVRAAVDILKDLCGGKLDLLINNAGIQCKGPAIEIEDEKIEACFQVNFFGIIRLIREAFPLIKEAQGTIAFTGSTAGVNPFPFASSYAASKAALHMYISTLALELVPFDIKVVNIITGGVETCIGDDYSLKGKSYYRVNGADVLNQSDNRRALGRMKTEEYSRKVVKDLQKISKPTTSNYFVFYRGSGSSIHKWLALLAPRWLIERKLKNDFQLDGPFRLLAQRNS